MAGDERAEIPIDMSEVLEAEDRLDEIVQDWNTIRVRLHDPAVGPGLSAEERAAARRFDRLAQAARDARRARIGGDDDPLARNVVAQEVGGRLRGIGAGLLAAVGVEKLTSIVHQAMSGATGAEIMGRFFRGLPGGDIWNKVREVYERDQRLREQALVALVRDELRIASTLQGRLDAPGATRRAAARVADAAFREAREGGPVDPRAAAGAVGSG